MTEAAAFEIADTDPEVLHSLLQVGVNLSTIDDVPQMLDMILTEARKLARAEAGSLFILEEGNLRLVVAQNDRVASVQVAEMLVNKKFPLTSHSVVGFVASTGRAINIPNSYMLPNGSPFRINRDFDSVTGYRIKSILAIPLKCPDGTCIGVLELFNRVGEDGRVSSFPEAKCGGIHSLASMAAVTIHNALLQDELTKAHLETIVRLSVAAEFRDNETAAHLRRLSHTSALIARAMGLDAKDVEMIRLASPMHDVGKIGLPDAILHKPGPLTPQERGLVQEHPLIGAEILGDPLNHLFDAARVAALTHHERWDGNGYPHGMAGEEIPVIGRVVGLADVFDALVSKRCYKEAFPLEKTLEIIRGERGAHFDPAVVDAFLEVLDEVLEFYRDPANRDETLGDI